MKLLFAIAGAVLGGLIDGPLTAIFGALLGFVLGAIFGRTSGKSAAASPGPTELDAAAEPALAQRVAGLEREVAMLRVEVKRLAQQLSAGRSPLAAAQTPDAAPSFFDAEPQPPHAPVATSEPAPAEPEVRLPLDAPTMAAAIANTSAVQTVATEPEAVANDFTLDIDEAETPSEARTTTAEPEQDSRGAAAPQSAPTAVPRDSRPPAVPAPPSPSMQERMPPFVRQWIFGGNTIVKVGVLLLFLGLAFLLRYAAERVTVPIELRYAGVALFGAVLLGLGWRLRERKDAAGGSGYGLILQGAGVGLFYLTTLAALKLNQLLPPELAFAFLFMVAVLSVVLAVAQNAPWLAYVATAEGFAAPVLVSTGSGNPVALFSYLAILDVGLFLIAWFKAWRPLNLVGFVGTFTLASAWAQKYYTDARYPVTQTFLLLFFALFTFIGVLFARRALAQGREPDAQSRLSQRAARALAQVGRVDSTLVFGVPLASFSLQYLLVRHDEFGPAWAALGFSLLYLLLGGALIRGRNPRYSLLGEAYVIVSVIFGTLTIPLALEGRWTGATWAIEAAGMFWLGTRQQRTYARAFALLVLGGATLRLASTLGLDWQAGTPLLTGSVLGMAMLSGSALAMFGVSRRGQFSPSKDLEAAGAMGTMVIGLAGLTAIPWLLLTPAWASVATSLLALGCGLMPSRVAPHALPRAGAVLHAVAVGSFIATLHTVEGSAMFSNGWQGLLTATLIGMSLLATCWFSLQAALRAAAARGTQPSWSLGSSVGLLAGLAVVNGSLLFVMPADQAALIWPCVGLGVLWVSLRVAHPALAVAWAALQALSAIALLAYGAPLWSPESATLTLWTPLVLTLAGLLSGDELRRAARRREPMAWVASPLLQWGVVIWSLAWWTQVLLPDGYRWMSRIDPRNVYLYGPNVLTAWVLATSAALALTARWRDWTVLGRTTWATLPAWALTAWLGAGIASMAPHEYLGWLVWPLALAWHLMLLRLQPRWGTTPALKPMHVGGLWLFVLLAARECQWWTASWGAAGSAWPVLGWVIMPTLVLSLLRHHRALQRWPLTEFRDSYLQVACAPIALYLLLWLWFGNTQPGNADPIPYVPLLNPLELGQGLVLFALALWQRELTASPQTKDLRKIIIGTLAMTAFGLYTGMVLRSCHHLAGVAWDSETLFDSKLTQAALSVAWAVVGVTLMLLGHRRVKRAVWITGAALLGVVVLKLFFVELADRGGLYRIVSFIVVGLLLLVVGYFAPVPPSRGEARGEPPSP